MKVSQAIIGFLVIALISFSSCAEKAEQGTVTANKQTMPKKAAVTKPVTGSMSLSISELTAKKGEEACVSFIASDFNNILGYQHSINFNPKQLAYVKTKNYGLPNLGDGNFGATKAENGTLTFVWFDMNVKGVSKPANSKVFDLCFKVLANSGDQCTVAISDTPTKMEVVGPQKNKLKLKTKSGVISVE